MKIENNYHDTVTYGIYNQNDAIHAVALRDGTLQPQACQTWDPPKNVGNTVHIIFKQGLVQVAARDVPKRGTTTLNPAGGISTSLIDSSKVGAAPRV